MKRAFFFDRDGTVNISPGAGRYVLRWDDFHFRPGVREMLGAVKSGGFMPILITNQQCVGKGELSPGALQGIHDRMQQALGPLGFEEISVCPHLEGMCDCRKPSPKLVLDAAAKHGFDLPQSWNVGDQPRDIEMGRRAGVGTNILLGSNEFPDWAAVLRVFVEALKR
jgi:D-glycero-D-manno-heptose 1,7-bisphosphate phosphatase